MKCLYITPFNPFPARSGGALLTDLMLRKIGAKCPVDVATFGDSLDYSPYPGVKNVFRFRKDPLYRVRALLGKFPESLERHADPQLKRLVWAGGYTHVFCDSFTPALNLLRPRDSRHKTRPFRTILLSHNIESQVERENVQYDAKRFSWHKRKILERDVKRMERAEAALLPRFDRVLSVSEHETRIMKERLGCRDNVWTLPISFGAKGSGFTENREPDTILFAGSMWWLPNRHGLAWFFENCWETILAARPAARVILAGNDKTGFAREMAQRYPNVTATGFVEDIEPFFRRASVFVLPILIGTGIKIKLLEAMGWGLPAVSTPKGVEGVPGFEEGCHALVGDAPPDFAKAVIRLLETPGLRERIARQARLWTESNEKAMESLLDEVFCDA
jgi:glycosyltransferase involved in cell wall biosynthesis